MALNKTIVVSLAKRLNEAERNVDAIIKITDDYPEMDWCDAYDIQDALRDLKEKEGVTITGVKAGLTSFAKMEQMGVTEPVMGFLTDYGSVPDGGEIDTSRLIHPKIEAEIAFVLKRDLTGPGCNIATVLAATDFVVPAVEVIDSRYENFKFDLKSVIADNTSAARYIVGGRHHSAQGLDLKNLGVVVEKNGKLMATAAGAAVLGHPAQSVAMLANMLAERGKVLPAGQLIMTGGITEAITVEAGDNITVRYQSLGSVSMRFV